MPAATIQTSQLTAHSGALSYLQAFTVADLDDSKLVVWLIASGTQTFSNVRWGGAGGTTLTNRLNYTSTALQMWELILPTPGTADIYFEASTTAAASMLALDISDTDLGQVPTFAINQGGISSDSSIRADTVPADALAMDVLMIGSTSETPTLHGLSVGTVLFNQVSAGAHVCVSTYAPASEESVTLGWNWTDALFRHAMCYFAAAPFPMVPVLPTSGMLSLVGFVPIAAATLFQILTPNTVFAASNLRDTLSASPPQRLEDIDESISAVDESTWTDDTLWSDGTGWDDDAEWWQAVDITASTDVRLGFPSPTSQELAGPQSIKVRVRKTGVANPIVTLQLWDSGIQRAPESNTMVTSLVGQVVELQFLASDLTDPSGAGAEIRIFGAAVS